MIQRIQSLFLLLAAVFLGISAWLGSASFIFTAVAILAMTLSLVTIFLYTNRKLQIRLITFTIVLDILAPWSLLFQNGFETISEHIGSGLLIVVAIILSFLARSGVLRDERLVRSADRLR